MGYFDGVRGFGAPTSVAAVQTDLVYWGQLLQASVAPVSALAATVQPVSGGFAPGRVSNALQALRTAASQAPRLPWSAQQLGKNTLAAFAVVASNLRDIDLNTAPMVAALADIRTFSNYNPFTMGPLLQNLDLFASLVYPPGQSGLLDAADFLDQATPSFRRPVLNTNPPRFPPIVSPSAPAPPKPPPVVTSMAPWIAGGAVGILGVIWLAMGRR